MTRMRKPNFTIFNFFFFFAHGLCIASWDVTSPKGYNLTQEKI